jgi:hypothetical protein
VSTKRIAEVHVVTAQAIHGTKGSDRGERIGLQSFTPFEIRLSAGKLDEELANHGRKRRGALGCPDPRSQMKLVID